MPEPYYPVPDPEPNDYWDPEPARCPECGTIVDARPCPDGLEGWCEEHGVVTPTYGDASQEPEMDEEE